MEKKDFFYVKLSVPRSNTFLVADSERINCDYLVPLAFVYLVASSLQGEVRWETL